METGIIISLISAGLGAGISLISVYINNKSQLNRDRLKYQNDFKLEKFRSSKRLRKTDSPVGW